MTSKCFNQIQFTIVTRSWYLINWHKKNLNTSGNVQAPGQNSDSYKTRIRSQFSPQKSQQMTSANNFSPANSVVVFASSEAHPQVTSTPRPRPCTRPRWVWCPCAPQDQPQFHYGRCRRTWLLLIDAPYWRPWHQTRQIAGTPAVFECGHWAALVKPAEFRNRMDQYSGHEISSLGSLVRQSAIKNLVNAIII